MQHRRQWSLAHHLGAVVFVAGHSALACATGDDEPSAPRGSAAATGAGAVTNAGAVTSAGAATASIGGTGASAAGSSGSPPLQLSGSDSGPPAAETEACQGETYEGKPIPVDMYFLVDSSASMAEPVQGGTKWQVVSNALVSFLSAPPNADGAVGVGYFPDAAPGSCTAGEPGCVCIPYTNRCAPSMADSCSPTDYEPAVGLVLPPDTSRVVADLGAHQLSGGTPTRPALEGTLQYLEQWATSHPDRKVVVVLATDGEPTGCERNRPQDIASLAARAWAGPSAIRTFVLGVGAQLGSLNAIAQAGGTDAALLVDTAGDVAQQLTGALDEIRKASSVACDFAIPSSTSGAKVDPTKVNVRIATSGGAASVVSQTFMSDPGNCGTAGGWHYDDPLAPTRIELCDSTCREVQSGSIRIQYGCDTVVRPPH